MAHAMRTSRLRQEILYEKELAVLKEEERMVQNLLNTYEYAIHKLQVEELAIKSQLSRARTRKVDMSSHSGTPADSVTSGSSLVDAYVANREVHGGMFSNESKPGITMNELQINQSSLNLDAAPLIHRMLHDSAVYEEEEEEDNDLEQ